MASKYQPLTDFLLKQNGKSVTISFDKINSILGFDLPSSASDTNAITWWANDTKSHVQTLAWLNAGYKTQNVSSTIRNNEINFVKESNESSDLKFVRDEMSKDDELYKLAEHGVSRTHIECLIWFRENEGKVVDNDALRGKLVPGATEDGYPYSARKPIPADRIVSEPHYLHAGIRGWYKPKGEKIVGYDKENRKPIWEGSDDFVQALQTGTGESLEEYDKEVEFDANRKWTVINYDHNGPASRYYEITGGYIQRCYENNIPIGIVFKEGENQNKILGLGLITKVSKNKLEYKIEPYKMSQPPKFKFVKKDFRCKKTQKDSKYRRGRFRDLVDAIIPELSPRFDAVKNDLGLSVQSRKRKFSYLGKNLTRNKPTRYFDYTWLGIYLEQPPPNPTSNKSDFVFSSRDVVQFQVGLNARDPLWSGLYIGRGTGVKHTRKKLLTLLKEQREECLRIFKTIAKGYVIKIYGRGKKDDTSNLLGEWITSELTDDDMDDILKKYSDNGADFRICKLFTKKEALKP